MSSKKVPTKRNQLEVIFKAYTEGERVPGNFVPYAPDGEIIKINFPESFYFDIEPYESSFIVSYQRDGLYQIYGTIEDFLLKNIELPEGIEKEVYLTSNKIYVKVVEGNAIEITEKQYNHELEKIQREKNQGKALGRVKKELEYARNNFEEFGIEEGGYDERLAEVENELGLELYADNSDIHQKYLEKESQIISPFPPNWKRLPFCRKYVLSLNQNIPITIKGKIKYENPTVCRIENGGCIKVPVKNKIVYIAVRSFVWMKGFLCYNLPEGMNLLTIKTIIYKFITDEEGNIEGIIYAAPPFDRLPYIEYVDTRAGKVYTIEGFKPTVGDCYYEYSIKETPFGTEKEPDSIFYPSICEETIDGQQIPCFEQYFDGVNLILNLNVIYKEEYEERTFFFKWADAIRNIEAKWSGWQIGDTCRPLQAGWVKNFNEICNDCFRGCDSNGAFQATKTYKCIDDPDLDPKKFYDPSFKILLNSNTPNENQEIKWAGRIAYHEAGHWLYWLMKNKNFEGSEFKETNKCIMGKYDKVGSLAEGFAESHMFEFLFAAETGYGTYELGEGYEIDTKCETLIPIGNDNYPSCKNICAQCDISSSIPKYCSNYASLCNDNINSPCPTLPISSHTALLRDIYDSKNHPVLDGFQDQVYLPIDQLFHCLKGKVDNINTILPFINALISDPQNKCTDEEKLNILLNYYFQ